MTGPSFRLLRCLGRREGESADTENLRDTLTNMFKTMILRPTISAIVNPVAQGITGAMGLSGAANAAGAVGKAGNLASTGGIVGGLSAFGSAFTAPFGSALTDPFGSALTDSFGCALTDT